MNRTLQRFGNKTFDWAGGRTCVHLARWHLRHMGHTVQPVPKFDSAQTAKKALKAKGWKNVPAMLDALLERIPPAAMVLGDIAVVPGDGMDAILICAGPRRVFGWHEEGPVPVFIEPDMSVLIGAWRV